MRSIPFFDYKRIYSDYKDDLLKIFDDVCNRGAYILQDDLEQFENSLSKFSGSKFAIGVNNATDALQIALVNGGIEEGDEVIISSHTMIATASAIKFAGGIPVPVEVGNDLLIDYQSIKKTYLIKQSNNANSFEWKNM